MNENFCRDERPGAEDDPGNGSWISDDPGSGGGGSGGGGSGGGGSGGGAGGGYWLSGDDGDEDDDDKSNGKWEGINLPYLKICHAGTLLRDCEGVLLTGSWTCRLPPFVEIAIGEAKHLDCALARSGRPIHFVKYVDRATIYGSLSDFSPGSFSLELRWQGGHYDYAKLNLMTVTVAGVSLGSIKIPLSGWRKAAEVEIRQGGSIWVNNQKSKYYYLARQT